MLVIFSSSPIHLVLVSSGDSLNKGLQNIGSIFLQMRTLSNSLGTGMDKLDGEPEGLCPPRQKAARSVCKQVIKVQDHSY